MESNVGEEDISTLPKLYTEKMAKVLKELEIERAKVALLEAELSKYSESGAEDGQQIMAKNADPNPLLLETVVHKLSEYLDHKTKASGRLVCQKWKEIITPEYLENSKLYLNFSSHVEVIDNMTLKLSTAFPESENEEWIRIPSYVDLKFQPSKNHRGTRMLLERLSSFGKCIKELKLRIPSKLDHVAQDLFIDILNFCNNLEVLKIPCPAIETLNSDVVFHRIKALEIGGRILDTEAYSVPTINSILRSTPNLKILKLTVNTEGDILSCFATCRDAGYLEDLVELVLENSFVTTASLTTLSQCRFKCLKTLNLKTDVILRFKAAAALTTLLSNLSPSLESLEIGMKILNKVREERVSLTIASIPRMEFLKSFYFNKEMTPEQGSIDELMDKFPKLETLSLGQYWLNDFEECGVADRLFPEYLAGGSQYSTLRNLWIPNLPMKNYETREDYSPLEIIARCFPQLQSFDVGFNFDEDEEESEDEEEHFETAISDLSYMSRLSELNIFFNGVSRSEFNDSVSEMFKYNFQGLKRLSFLNYDKVFKINLDKKTVKKAFQNAPSLTNLKFRYFSIKAKEKQEIFGILSKINRVRFRECSFENVPIDQDFARASTLPGKEFRNFEIGVSTGLDLGY